MLDWFFKRNSSATAEKNGKSDRLNVTSSPKTNVKASDIAKSNIDEYSPPGPLSTSSTKVVNHAEQVQRGGLFVSRCSDNSDCARLYLAMFKEH